MRRWTPHWNCDCVDLSLLCHNSENVVDCELVDWRSQITSTYWLLLWSCQWSHEMINQHRWKTCLKVLFDGRATKKEMWTTIHWLKKNRIEDEMLLVSVIMFHAKCLQLLSGNDNICCQYDELTPIAIMGSFNSTASDRYQLSPL